jgi:acetoin utilization deacetylase AcuC-like enzyme
MPIPIVFHPAYEAVLPDGHRFPMSKYARLARVLQDLGLAPQGFIRPEEAPAELIALAHDRRHGWRCSMDWREAQPAAVTMARDPRAPASACSTTWP